MTRRISPVLPLVAAALAALTSPAIAQRAQPVEGGGSFNDAPIVVPGTYRDTIRPSERLFYAIEVMRGQKLNARAVIEGTLSTDDSPIRSEMRMHGPSRNEIPGQLSIHPVWSRDSKLRLTGDKVDEDEQFFTEPGLYYVALALDSGRRTEFNVELKFTVKGIAVEPEQTPSPTGSPTPIESPTPDDESTAEPTPEDTEGPPADRGSAAPPGPGGDDDLPMGLFVGFFVAGALGGSAIELFRGGRARARTSARA